MSPTAAKSTATFAERAALALVFVSLPFAQTTMRPGVSVADLVLLLAIVVLAIQLWRATSQVRVPVWSWMAGLLVLWSVAGAVALTIVSPLPFSMVELAKSLAKLVFYLAGSSLVAITLQRVRAASWTELLLWAITVHSFIAFYVYLAMLSPLGLPYRFLWTGSQGDEMAAYTLRFGQPFVRLRGLAAEPSYLGLYLTLGLALVLFARPAARRRPWRELAVTIAIVLTFSLATYVLAGVALALVLAIHRRRVLAALPWAAAAIATTLLLATLVAPIRTALRVGVVERTSGILGGSLSRAETKRVAGSWAAAGLMAQASPFFGAGLGNFDVAMAAVLPKLDPRLEMPPGNQGWNDLAYALGTLGWPGLVVMLSLVGLAARAHPARGVLLLVATFADGTLLSSTFWIFYALLASPPRELDELAEVAALEVRERRLLRFSGTSTVAPAFHPLSADPTRKGP